MSRILFIRHAETDMAGTFCGHSDPPVNARGYQQIQMLVKALASEAVTAIYSSDLQRAATTAEALASAFEARCVIRPGLREIDFGKWEGLSWKEVERRDSAYAQRWVEDYPNLAAPGGESFPSFQSRVTEEVSDLLRLAGNECTAVVTHGGVMRMVLRTLCGVEDEQEVWKRTSLYCCFFPYTREASR